jgi:phospholipase C
VPPPPATSPDTKYPDGFDFGYYGVRVPAVIVSPHIAKGSVVRPTGPWPFDHTSISATLHALFGTRFLTARDAVAPTLLPALTDGPDNPGPAQIIAPPVPAASADAVLAASNKPPNGLQSSMAAIAPMLPGGSGQAPAPHPTTAGTAVAAVAGMRGFMTTPPQPRPPADSAG